MRGHTMSSFVCVFFPALPAASAVSARPSLTGRLTAPHVRMRAGVKAVDAAGRRHSLFTPPSPPHAQHAAQRKSLDPTPSTTSRQAARDRERDDWLAGKGVKRQKKKQGKANAQDIRSFFGAAGK